MLHRRSSYFFAVASFFLGLVFLGCENLGYPVTPNVVQGPGDFTLTLTPVNASASVGDTTAFTVGIQAGSSFSSAIHLALGAASSLSCAEPACALDISTISSGSASAVFHVTGSAAGNFPLTVTGTSGSLTRTASATLQIVAPLSPDFTFSVMPSATTVSQGASASLSFSLGALNGFSAPVTISIAPPSGIACTSSCSLSATLSTPGSMSFTAGPSVPVGTYSLTFTATSGTLTHSQTVLLNVSAAPQPDFLFSVSPATASVAQGAGTSPFSFSLTPVNGFSAPVTISVAPPAGISCSTSCTITGTVASPGSQAFLASSSAPSGTYTVLFTATAGSLSHTATAVLTITAVQPPPPLTLPPCGGTPLPVTAPAAGPTSFIYTGDVEPPAALYDARHNVIFASNHQLAEIDVLSPNTLSVIARIPVTQPRGLDISADGSTLIVGTDAHFFYRIDTTSLCVLQRIDMGLTGVFSSVSPMYPVALSDGSVMFAMHDVNSTADGLALWAPSTGVKVLNAGTYLYFDVGSIFRSGDHRHAYIAEDSNGGYVASYDVATQTFTTLAPQPGTFASVLAVNADGSRLYMTNDCCGLSVTDSSLHILASYTTYFANSIALSADQSRLYVQEGYNLYVTVLDANTLAVLGYLPAQVSNTAFTNNSVTFYDVPPLNAGTYDSIDGAGRFLSPSPYGLTLVQLDSALLPAAPAATLDGGSLSPNSLEQGASTKFDFGAGVTETPTAATLRQGTVAEAVSVHSNSANELQLGMPSFPAGCGDLTVSYTAGTGFFIPNAFCDAPIITALDGDAGPTGGGAKITIYGKGFGPHPSVSVAGVPATIMPSSLAYLPSMLYDPESVTVTAPAGSPGPADVRVTNGASASVTMAGAFTYYTRQDVAIPAAAAPIQLIYDAGRNRLLWTDSARNLVVVASASTLQTLQEVPVGKQPYGLALSPDGTKLTVATVADHSVSVYDADTFGQLGTVAAVTMSSSSQIIPLYVAGLSNGEALIGSGFVPSVQAGNGGLFTYNFTSNTLSAVPAFGFGCSGSNTDVVASADGTFARAGGALYTTATNTVSFPLPAYSSCSQIAISADGTLNADTNHINDRTGAQRNFYSQPARLGGKVDGFIGNSSAFPLNFAMNATGSLAASEYATTYFGNHTTETIRIFETGHGSLVRSPIVPGGFLVPILSKLLVLDPAGQRLWTFTPSGLTSLQFLADPLAIGEVTVNQGTLTILGSGFTAGSSVSVDGNALASVSGTGTTTLTAPLPSLSSGNHSVTVTNPGSAPYTLPVAFNTP